MLWLITLGSVTLLLVFIVYLLYFLLVYNRKDIAIYLNKINHLEKNDDLSPVTVIVNTYNEAKIIRRKIENISCLNYPREKLEVLVIDDCSSDGTGDIAAEALAEFEINGSVIRNAKRLGLNESLNLALLKASYDVVCVTDSDVMLHRDALRKAVAVLKNFDDAGGVTGKIVPVYTVEGFATLSENSYRFFYDKCMLAESAVHSSFPGNGPLMVFKKAYVSHIPADLGSTDANIAMSIIKSGKRFLYVPEALIYEPVPEKVSQQRLQKVRRARRLIQVFLRNLDVFGNGRYGKFGTVIFPLKFLIHVVCPLSLFLGLVSVFLWVAQSGNFMLELSLLIMTGILLGVFAFSKRVRAFLVSFIFHQVYLLLGLFSSRKKSLFWKTIERR